MAKFYIYKDPEGERRWRLRADNGRVVADSGEGYVRKIDCEHSRAVFANESVTEGGDPTR